MKTNQKTHTGLERLSRWLPFRLFCYVAAIVAVAVVWKLLIDLFVPAMPSPLYEPLTILRNLSLVAAMFGIYSFLVRILERRAADEIDVRRSLPGFVAGALFGSSLIGAVYLVFWRLGVAHFSGGTGSTGLGVALLHPTVTALLEELLFRVVIFRTFEEIGGTTVAIVLSAAIFGMSHAANPGANPFDISALMVEAGVLLSLAFVLTRNIWLAAGLHMGWNFAQSFIFGADVSGLTSSDSLLKTSLSGPTILTGGSFGPEGSLVALAICLVASAILFLFIHRNGRWQAPRFRLRSQRCSSALKAGSRVTI